MVYTNYHTGDDDGVQYGNATTQKIGFYGATPGERPTTPTAVVSTAITAVSTTAATSGTTANGLFGFTTSTQMAALITAVNDLITRGALQTTAINTLRSNLNTLGLQG